MRTSNDSDFIWNLLDVEGSFRFQFRVSSEQVYVSENCIIQRVFFTLIYCSLPWDQETFLGYIGEMVVSMICMEGYLIDNGALLLLFISMCLHHQAFYRMFRNSLCKLNRPDKRRNDKEHLCNLIRFHISVKE